MQRRSTTIDAVKATIRPLCSTPSTRRTIVCPTESAHRLVTMLTKAAVTANKASAGPIRMNPKRY